MSQKRKDSIGAGCGKGYGYHMNALVGYTGFVGSNLYAAGSFDAVYHSRNIGEAYGTAPDLLIYAGLRAEKYLANNEPKKDKEQIVQAEENIRKINPKKLVLISTIDVFKDPKGVDETSAVDTEALHAYGYHRYQLELWVRQHYPDALIIRLPGLFGKNIKKNFIYDYIHVIPFMLKQQKFDELSRSDEQLRDFYELQDNGFYKVRELNKSEQCRLKEIFKKLGFSALNFTDSRSTFQFYNLARLWNDIRIALEHQIKLWHPATEPICAGELYQYLTGEEFVNELGQIPADYDYRTIYADVFGGSGGYISMKDEILMQIKEFVQGET